MISQKNDTIGYTKLITPVISSRIKPGMFVHSRRDSLCGNPCYYTRDYVVCSVTGCFPVKLTWLLKASKWPFQEHQSNEVMAHNWCPCLANSRPPNIYRFLPTKDVRRVLVSDKRSLCCRTLQPHCPRWVHSRHHPTANSMGEGSLWMGCIGLHHAPEISKMEVPRKWYFRWHD